MLHVCVCVGVCVCVCEINPGTCDYCKVIQWLNKNLFDKCTPIVLFYLQFWKIILQLIC